jgi:hypothetical protein
MQLDWFLGCRRKMGPELNAQLPVPPNRPLILGSLAAEPGGTPC